MRGQMSDLEEAFQRRARRTFAVQLTPKCFRVREFVFFLECRGGQNEKERHQMTGIDGMLPTLDGLRQLQPTATRSGFVLSNFSSIYSLFASTFLSKSMLRKCMR